MYQHIVEPGQVFVPDLAHHAFPAIRSDKPVPDTQTGNRSDEGMIRLPRLGIELPKRYVRLDHEEDLCSVVVAKIDCRIRLDFPEGPSPRPLVVATAFFEHEHGQGHPSPR